MTNQPQSVLHFLVKDVRMCVYIKNVKKILPLAAFEMVPSAPSYLAGLLNIEGKTVPVIDIAIRAGLNRFEPYTLDTPLLYCSYENKEGVLIVDKVFDIDNMEVSRLQLNEKFNPVHSPFLASIVHQSENSLLINLNFMMDITLTRENNL